MSDEQSAEVAEENLDTVPGPRWAPKLGHVSNVTPGRTNDPGDDLVEELEAERAALDIKVDLASDETGDQG